MLKKTKGDINGLTKTENDLATEKDDDQRIAIKLGPGIYVV